MIRKLGILAKLLPVFATSLALLVFSACTLEELPLPLSNERSQASDAPAQASYESQARPGTSSQASSSGASPASSRTELSSLFLEVSEPADEAVVETEVLDVAGSTVPGAVVSVGDGLAEVDGLGRFRAAVTLVEGPNLIDVVASDGLGQEKRLTLVVVFTP